MSSWQRSGNGISEREVIDRLEEMGIPSEIAREYAAQTAQAASVLINAEKPVPPVPQRAAERPTEAPLTLPEDRGTMKRRLTNTEAASSMGFKRRRLFAPSPVEAQSLSGAVSPL